MKYLPIATTLLCLLLALSGYSQTENTGTDPSSRSFADRKNEIKLGAVKLIAGPILDLEYERALNSSSSLGANVVANLSEDEFLYDFAFTPYFRMYFTESREYGTRGFFAQAFMGYSSGTDYDYDYDPNSGIYEELEQNWNSLGAGLGVGTKWVNRHGFVFQLVFGLGRNFIVNDYAPEIFLQGDAYIGYRF